MQQKYKELQHRYKHLQVILGSSKKSERQDDVNVINLLNKHITSGSPGRNIHRNHTTTDCPQSDRESDTSLQNIIKVNQNHELTHLLSRLFSKKCSALQVFGSKDRANSFVEALKVRNRVHSKLDLSNCNLPPETSSILNRYIDANITRVNISRNILNLKSLNNLYHQQLTELVLQNCNLHTPEIEQVFKKLTNTGIVRLCLSSPLPINRNILTSYQGLYDFVSSKPTLCILELAFMQIAHSQELFKVLSKTNIQFLDLSGNDRVRGTYKRLRTLKLRSNNLERIPELACQEHFPQIQHLDLSNNNLPCRQFTFVFSGKPSVNLVTLIADDNRLTYGLQIFTKYLRQSFSLRHLSLKNCWLNEQGLRHIMMGVEGSNSLEKLNLSHNRVAYDGAAIISLALPKCSLKELFLVECQINDEGGQSIANRLEHNKHLQLIDLSHNRLNCQTGKTFVRILRTNHTLINVNLSRNAVAYDQLKEILSCLDRNIYLKKNNLKHVKPRQVVDTPPELVDKEIQLMKKEDKLKMETRTLQDMYNQIRQKFDQVGDYEPPPEYESDNGLSEIKYREKLKDLRAEITRVEKQKNFLFGAKTPSLSTPKSMSVATNRTKQQ